MAADRLEMPPIHRRIRNGRSYRDGRRLQLLRSALSLLLLSWSTASAFVSTRIHHYPSPLTILSATDTKRNSIPFLIERLPDRPNPRVYKEIADMCIEAFFNDGEPGRSIPVWKSLQLGYLRGLQEGDLRRRRTRDRSANMMFVARRVVEADQSSASKAPLILDLSIINNFHALSGGAGGDYVRGEVLGFVEVTKRPYGVGSDVVHEEAAATRPVLTNLSVEYTCRGSGMGSKLLDLCEREVVRQWGGYEIILEVEHDNASALAFYQKRGYQELFEDPTSRRYELSGVWLQQVRCRRKVLRKRLMGMPTMEEAADEVQSTVNFGIRVLQRLRDNVFAV